MKALVIYNPNSERSRSVDEFNHNLEVRTGRKLELLSTETTEGSAMAELYGIMDYPAIVVTTDDGKMQKLWQGQQLPLVDEVVSYLIA